MEPRIKDGEIKRIRHFKSSGYYKRNIVEIDISMKTRKHAMEFWLMFFLPVYADNHNQSDILYLEPNPHAIHPEVCWRLYLNKELRVFENFADLQHKFALKK